MNTAVVLHSVAANGGDELLQKVLERGLKDIARTDVLCYTTNDETSYPFIEQDVFLDDHLTGDKLFSNPLISHCTGQK